MAAKPRVDPEASSDKPNYEELRRKRIEENRKRLESLPSAFCDMNFSKDDSVILEDEDGLEWEAIYLHRKNGLSGGWRGFSIDHDLEDGDALVFELVKPTRFKVYIKRAVDCKKHDLDLEVATPKKPRRYALKEDKENEHVHSALHKILKREQLRAEQNVSTQSAETAKRSRKRKLDLSEPSTREHSGGQQRAHHESAVMEISYSNGVCHPDTTLAESRQAKSGRWIPRNGGPATEEVVKSATFQEAKYRNNASQPLTKHKIEQNSCYSQKRKGLERNPTRVVDEDKGVVLTKKVRVTKVVEHGSNSQEAKKSTPHLLHGTQIKAVGVCSIARNGSSARKLPGSRSYSFFSPGNSAVTPS